MVRPGKINGGRHRSSPLSMAFAVMFLGVLFSVFLWLMFKPALVDLTTYEKAVLTGQIELVQGRRGTRLLIRHSDGTVLGFYCDVWGRSRTCIREAEMAGLRTGDIGRVIYLRPPGNTHLEEPVPLSIQVGGQTYMNCSQRIRALDLDAHADEIGLCRE